MKVTIIGNGDWGSALYKLISENAYDVSYWKKHEIITDADIVLLAVPTPSLRSVLTYIQKRKGLIIINSAKGIESQTHLLPCQVVEEILGKNVNYFSLIGPSFAKEVKEEMPTLVNLGFRNPGYSEEIKKLFQRPYFRIRLTRAVEAIELSAALKNVYAIACGISQGLGFGDNTRAKLITLALEEIYLLIKELDYKLDVSCAPGTLGDLILTASSLESRNFRFGVLLSKYGRVEALKRINSTVEGVNTALSVPYFRQKTTLKLPLASLVYNLIYGDRKNKVEDRFDQFVGQII